jgi:Domain of unknown function (DUF4376)
MSEFFIEDWYWTVGDDQANVWSSARAISVPASDAAYAQWKTDTGSASATTIASQEELYAMFAVRYPRGALTTYAWDCRWRKEQAGITLSSGMPIKSDDRAQAKITGAYTAALVKPDMVTQWQAADGTVHDLDAAQITQMNYDLLTHINNCFAISSDVLAQIEAGTITALTQIDAAFNAPMAKKNQDWLRLPEKAK